MTASAVCLPFSMSVIPDGTRTPISGYDTTTYEQSRRQVSSVVISEQIIGDLPESGGIKYVEIPVIEEVIKHVPRREIVEVEKIVPKYEYEYVDRIVEVPQIRYVDKHVEVEQLHEVIRHVPKREVREIPREVIKTVPKVEVVTTEKVVNVPGEIIEVPKHCIVENKVPVKRFRDKNMPVVVAQSIRPVVTESPEIIDVDIFEYEPQIIPVDVQVAKPVPSHLTAVGATQEIHRTISVPAAQYNSILKSINFHLGSDIDSLPYIKEQNFVPFLSDHEMPGTSAPIPGAMIDTGRVDGAMNMVDRDGAVMTTSSSLYQSRFHPGHTGSVAGQDHILDASVVPPVYPNMMSRDIVESVAPFAAKTPSQYNPKSHKSGRSFVQLEHKRRGCGC